MTVPHVAEEITMTNQPGGDTLGAPDPAGPEDELGGPDRGPEDELGGSSRGPEDELGGPDRGPEDELGGLL
jgi:hypothetical protein